MTHRQYQQVLRNRCRRPVRPLFGTEADGRLLRLAARAARRRARVARELIRVLPSDWLRVIEVEQVEGGIVVLSVTDSAVREQVQRESGWLEKCLGHSVAGVRRLRVT